MDPLVTALADITVGNYLTLALVLITAWYAYQTRLTVKAMEKQSEQQMRPYVTVRPLRDAEVLHLQVKNTGRTAAENLKLEIDSSFHCGGEEDLDLKTQHLFSSGVQSFAPGAEVTYFLGMDYEIFGDEESDAMPLNFTVTAKYSYGGTEVSEETGVDLDQFAARAITYRGSDRELHKIRKAVEEVASRLKGFGS